MGESAEERQTLEYSTPERPIGDALSRSLLFGGFTAFLFCASGVLEVFYGGWIDPDPAWVRRTVYVMIGLMLVSACVGAGVGVYDMAKGRGRGLSSRVGFGVCMCEIVFVMLIFFKGK